MTYITYKRVYPFQSTPYKKTLNISNYLYVNYYLTKKYILLTWLAEKKELYKGLFTLDLRDFSAFQSASVAIKFSNSVCAFAT